ncbi:MAG: RidA family protein [Actinobacteria bacterium]|nr:RidA family protein [Actinomycetota bacterium]
MSATERLRTLGLALPPLRPRAGNYRGWRRIGDTLYLAGQGADGWVGRVGDDLTLEGAQLAARDCGLNLLAQTADALGSVDAVEAIAKVTGFVACVEGFDRLPQVIDGASDLFVDVFGERGQHARSAIGVQHLPKGFAVEIEMVVAVRSGATPASYRHAV